MIDEATKTAKYEIGGREVWLRKLTVGQMARLETLKGDRGWIEATAGGRFRVTMMPELLAQLLSIALTDEQKKPVKITTEEAEDLDLEMAGEIVDDFFTLHPSLAELWRGWLLATLNSSLVGENGTGKPASSGFTLRSGPAEETSAA